MITQRIDSASAAMQTAQEGLERMKAGIVVTKRLACIAGGTFLVISGLRRRTVGGAALALVGTDLLYSSFHGDGNHLYKTIGEWIEGSPRALPYGQGVKVKESVVVRKPAKDLYRIWRDFETLPAFMRHLQSVQTINKKKSHWTVKDPRGPAIEWDAEVIADREGEIIGWRSVNGSVVAHAGSVRFEEMKGGDHTRVIVALQYNPVAGEAGAAAARLLGSDPKKRIREDLQRFREFAESVDLGVMDKLLHRSRSS